MRKCNFTPQNVNFKEKNVHDLAERINKIAKVLPDGKSINKMAKGKCAEWHIKNIEN